MKYFRKYFGRFDEIAKTKNANTFSLFLKLLHVILFHIGMLGIECVMVDCVIMFYEKYETKWNLFNL